MKNSVVEVLETGVYKPHLKQDKEDVISAHFMHEINQDKSLSLYALQDFHRKSLAVSPQMLVEKLIPALIKASDKFITERVTAVKKRVYENFREFGLSSASEIGLPEMITEVMVDRQFLKGSKSNISRTALCEKIKRLCQDKKIINMVIPALPYKSSSPLKARGSLPGLAEINFLLGLTEITKVIDIIYREKFPEIKSPLAKFTVICDGSRFNNFLNEPDDVILEYQRYLHTWIKLMGISDFIEIIDYKDILSEQLDKKLLEEKNKIRQLVRKEYENVILPLLNPCDMYSSINKAIEADPDPEKSNKEGRFVPLFKSLIYIINYKTLSVYSNISKRNPIDLYKELTEHIFYPYAILKREDIISIEKLLSKSSDLNIAFKEEEILEYLRQSMLYEAWYAAIEYIAEIRSDRDLQFEPIISCLPECIRWTIHAKPGQLAILTTTVSGDPVQPWHGIGVFKSSKQDKIKLYTLPVLSLEGSGAIPVIISKDKIISDLNEYNIRNQPLFYIDSSIQFQNIGDFFEKIAEKLTRSRKS